MKTAIALLLLTAACTKPADRCTSNLDCTDPAYPFCDVTGQFPASGGDMNVCTIPPPAADAGVPSDAPSTPVPGGCSPGAATCTNNELTVCNADGMTATMTACPVSCEPSGMACKTIVPSNGLGTALAAAAAQPDVTLPSGATINTDTGAIMDSGGNPIEVASLVVANGTGSLRAFIARSFSISKVSASGNASVAFVAAGSIMIGGTLDVSANGTTPGPGVSIAPQASSGLAGGGGGNATTGGTSTAGSSGAAQTTFSPLGGGGGGGAGVVTGDGPGGGGGGAIELVSSTAIDLLAAGVIDVGGGGGQAGAGGGAGGTVVLEAPVIDVEGIVGAGGGGGGGDPGCASPAGQDATPATAASGGGCRPSQFAFEFGGGGGFASQVPGAGLQYGGGGAVGRLDLVTLDGTYKLGTSAVVGAVLTTEKLVTE